MLGTIVITTIDNNKTHRATKRCPGVIVDNMLEIYLNTCSTTLNTGDHYI